MADALAGSIAGSKKTAAGSYINQGGMGMFDRLRAKGEDVAKGCSDELHDLRTRVAVLPERYPHSGQALVLE